MAQLATIPASSILSFGFPHNPLFRRAHPEPLKHIANSDRPTWKSKAIIPSSFPPSRSVPIPRSNPTRLRLDATSKPSGNLPIVTSIQFLEYLQSDLREGDKNGVSRTIHTLFNIIREIPIPASDHFYSMGVRNNRFRIQLTFCALMSCCIAYALPFGTESKGTSVNDPVEETGVIVVGGGLAGLAAARRLNKEGVSFLLLEASDSVGGRVRTDKVDGFLLDRGFQIFLSAYPECKKVLDYEALELKPFYAGAMVWYDNTFHRVADPFRHPLDGVLSLTNPIGTIVDKVKVGLLRFKSVVKPYNEILTSTESSISLRLLNEGFSSQMIDRFFRPFLGGIFFDRDLKTTSRMLEFVFKVLALGDNTVPSLGIGAIPDQLASSLPHNSIRLNSAVSELTPLQDESGAVKVILKNGKTLLARNGVIVAVEGPEASRLLKEEISSSPSKQTEPRSTVCLYFSAPKPAIDLPVLFLNGTNEGIVNNMCFLSNIAPSYAPSGKALVSVSLVGLYKDKSNEELESMVKKEMETWFGKGEVDAWKHIKTYRIPFAQPCQIPPTDLIREISLGKGLYVCGDHRDSATFDGALVSGRRAAEALLKDAAI